MTTPTSVAAQEQARARARAQAQLRESGFVFLGAGEARHALELNLEALAELGASWERLPRDTYLRDGGRYRARRHSCFVQTLAPALLESVPHRAHWQPTAYNALHGGLTRWFEPIEPPVAEAPAWRHTLAALGELFAQLQPVARWYIEAHQFRIDTAEGIGRPTPEGAHRDGVDFVAIVLVRRGAVRGGETRVFEAQGSRGVRFTMEQPWSTLLLDDARVIHETTPIQADSGGRPESSPDAAPSSESSRDTLVLTYRARGFQEPAAGG